MSFPVRPRGTSFSRANPKPAAAVKEKPVEVENDLDYLLQPNWLKPFSAAPNVRFTRTPDSLARTRAADEATTLPAREEEEADAFWMTEEAAFVETHLHDNELVDDFEDDEDEYDDFPGDAALDEEPEPEVLTAQSTLYSAARRTNVDVRPIAAKARAPKPAPEVVVPDTGLLNLQSWPSISVRASFTLPITESRKMAEAVAPRRQRRSAPPVATPSPAPAVTAAKAVIEARTDGEYELPPLELLTEPDIAGPNLELSEEYLDRTSFILQQTLHDFGVKGEIIDASPGPVVTLYELEPAPGTKSSRVISLSADISRSMSAVSARVAVVEGRNVIGIELPNNTRETVYLRELLASHEFATARTRLGLCLGKTIGGEPVIADLARMPHLLVAGTTGSGKSVAINTMILSLLYRMTPEECRLIMIDPKMLELSVYEGIPHLLTPVVTDPRKAVVALKWAVREMEERYKKMSKLGVRNIDGFNQRINEIAAGTAPSDEDTASYTRLPYIVVIVDEMADLMMVAGKDIEGAIQRLAQMARAAGIHLIMATQRPSVDVITGTIKANFPTRISFQVTSKIDSRTILGEMGAEQLLGQGDMLYMAGGGRITRVHGPFVSDAEVEHVVDHLKQQGRPDYLDDVTALDEPGALPRPASTGAPAGDEDSPPVMDGGSFGDEASEMYDQAVAVVLRDRKASTSYIQRRLGIGYNRAASIMERMENEGIVGQANHAGKREILLNSR